MEYKFANTSNGPVVVGEDEILFFNQLGPLQDYIDADPEFFTKAYDFFEVNMREQADHILLGLKQDVVGGDWMSLFHLYYGAATQLKRFEYDTQHGNVH